MGSMGLQEGTGQVGTGQGDTGQAGSSCRVAGCSRRSRAAGYSRHMRAGREAGSSRRMVEGSMGYHRQGGSKAAGCPQGGSRGVGCRLGGSKGCHHLAVGMEADQGDHLVVSSQGYQARWGYLVAAAAQACRGPGHPQGCLAGHLAGATAAAARRRLGPGTSGHPGWCWRQQQQLRPAWWLLLSVSAPAPAPVLGRHLVQCWHPSAYEGSGLLLLASMLPAPGRGRLPLPVPFLAWREQLLPLTSFECFCATLARDKDFSNG